ncbi:MULTISPECIES: DUF6479 family protein [Streptomyces]|uniref:DUF6479 family protein n=1 Tax=Streptomyces TaxID=1883 RepID=UPI00131656B5|nr:MULTISPECIES: DUF6479 family protein [Streptomyces]QGZ52359.1 hypothetical protein GPZ77_32100 [Streptomyces sp. QHH-9511]GGT85792.1 hypothetical protein GCM10010272_33230 [Streptomyces lateritius]
MIAHTLAADSTVTLAAAGSNALLFAVAIGVVIVGVLLGAFYWGSRRAARRRRPVGDPTQANARHGRDSWSTPEHDPDLGDHRR